MSLLESSNSALSSFYPVFSSQSDTSWHLWHSRLGHPNSSRLKSMFQQNLLGNKPIVFS
ncbi:unnamed protein product, partial [Linum tenue]